MHFIFNLTISLESHTGKLPLLDSYFSDFLMTLSAIVTVMRIRIIFSLSVMQFQTFLELSHNL